MSVIRKKDLLLLEGARDARPGPGMGGHPVDAALAEVDLTAVRTFEPGQQFEQGRLSGNVRADDALDAGSRQG